MSMVGPRSFSIGATSSMLMLPSNKGTFQWREKFYAGEDYITFTGMEDMKIKIKKWIDKPDECLKISESMNRRMKNHTYTKRFKEILDIVTL